MTISDKVSDNIYKDLHDVQVLSIMQLHSKRRNRKNDYIVIAKIFRLD